MLGAMDERKKSILLLERRKAEELSRIRALLRELGRRLLERASPDGMVERELFDKARAERARLDEARRQVEEDAERAAAIDKAVAEAERQNAETARRLAEVYPDLGETALADEAFAVFAAPYKARVDAVRQKLDELQGRLRDVDGKSGANVFVWLGKNAQSLVLKSFLAKTEASLRRIYAEAGAEFVRGGPCGVNAGGVSEAGVPGEGALGAGFASVRALWDESEERMRLVASLKEEKRVILDSFGHGGSAGRKKAEIARQAGELDRQIDEIYLRLGRKAEEPSTRAEVQRLFDAEADGFLADVLRRRGMVNEYDAQTAKLKASLDIDEERAEIARLERSIAEQQARITAAQGVVARCEKDIAGANERIAGLMKV
jgi:hypothetical protein